VEYSTFNQPRVSRQTHVSIDDVQSSKLSGIEQGFFFADDGGAVLRGVRFRIRICFFSTVMMPEEGGKRERAALGRPFLLKGIWL
jgi:hypothetical protein